MTMRKYNLIILLAATCMMAYGQQIAEVIEYTPAPGQFINTASGSPEAALSLTTENGSLVSLGGFGGYIILRSSSAIVNDPNNPYGVDFTIYGNAMSHWSEPGIVSVMKDDNENGVPDETWYELAGSDHFFSSTITNYEISYTNPFLEKAADIPSVTFVTKLVFANSSQFFIDSALSMACCGSSLGWRAMYAELEPYTAEKTFGCFIAIFIAP